MREETRARLQNALAALASGDRSAFDEVFSLAWPVLRSLAVSLLGDPAEAEDAAQRALLKLFSRASDYDANRPALPWVLAFGANEVRTVRGRRKRRHFVEVGDALPAQDDPESTLLESDLQAALQEILGTMTVEDRVALGLLPTTDSTVAPATLRKRKQRALERLRAAWRRMHGHA